MNKWVKYKKTSLYFSLKSLGFVTYWTQFLRKSLRFPFQNPLPESYGQSRRGLPTGATASAFHGFGCRGFRVGEGKGGAGAWAWGGAEAGPGRKERYQIYVTSVCGVTEGTGEEQAGVVAGEGSGVPSLSARTTPVPLAALATGLNLPRFRALKDPRRWGLSSTLFSAFQPREHTDLLASHFYFLSPVPGVVFHFPIMASLQHEK